MCCCGTSGKFWIVRFIFVVLLYYFMLRLMDRIGKRTSDVPVLSSKYTVFTSLIIKRKYC